MILARASAQYFKLLLPSLINTGAEGWGEREIYTKWMGDCQKKEKRGGVGQRKRVLLEVTVLLGNSVHGNIFQINTFEMVKFKSSYQSNLSPPLLLNLFVTNSQIHSYGTRTASNN